MLGGGEMRGRGNGMGGCCASSCEASKQAARQLTDAEMLRIVHLIRWRSFMHLIARAERTARQGRECSSATVSTTRVCDCAASSVLVNVINRRRMPVSDCNARVECSWRVVSIWWCIVLGDSGGGGPVCGLEQRQSRKVGGDRFVHGRTRAKPLWTRSSYTP